MTIVTFKAVHGFALLLLIAIPFVLLCLVIMEVKRALGHVYRVINVSKLAGEPRGTRHGMQTS